MYYINSDLKEKDFCIEDDYLNDLFRCYDVRDITKDYIKAKEKMVTKNDQLLSVVNFLVREEVSTLIVLSEILERKNEFFLIKLLDENYIKQNNAISNTKEDIHNNDFLERKEISIISLFKENIALFMKKLSKNMSYEERYRSKNSENIILKAHLKEKDLEMDTFNSLEKIFKNSFINSKLKKLSKNNIINDFNKYIFERNKEVEIFVQNKKRLLRGINIEIEVKESLEGLEKIFKQLEDDIKKLQNNLKDIRLKYDLFQISNKKIKFKDLINYMSIKYNIYTDQDSLVEVMSRVGVDPSRDILDLVIDKMIDIDFKISIKKEYVNNEKINDLHEIKYLINKYNKPKDNNESEKNKNVNEIVLNLLNEMGEDDKIKLSLLNKTGDLVKKIMFYKVTKMIYDKSIFVFSLKNSDMDIVYKALDENLEQYYRAYQLKEKLIEKESNSDSEKRMKRKI